MSKFAEYIGSQFGNPHGIIGAICCFAMNVINNKMYKKVISLIDAADGSKILDVGCGNGYLLKLINKKNHSYDLYGIDISEDMKIKTEAANKKAAREGRLKIETGDCCRLPYNDGMFSVITSVNTVYFWEDVIKGLSEIKRVLKDNGTFYNVVYTKEWLDKLSYTKKGFQKFEPESLVDMGYKVGFKNVTVQDIVKWKSFVVIYQNG